MATYAQREHNAYLRALKYLSGPITDKRYVQDRKPRARCKRLTSADGIEYYAVFDGDDVRPLSTGDTAYKAWKNARNLIK